MSTQDPWLWLGCKCYVWNAGYKTVNTDLLKFAMFNINGVPMFEVSKGCYNFFKKYYPIDTPWNNAPKSAQYIKIYQDGTFEFLNELKQSIQQYQRMTDIARWDDCPEHLRNEVWKRPEWAE